VLKDMAVQERFEGLFRLTDKELKETVFYFENKELLDQPRGAGYWLWKPYIILEVLNHLSENDILFYIDSGDTFISGTKNKIDELMKDRDIVISTSFFTQKDYTKRDCFHFMNCDEEKYWNAHQAEAGILVFKNNLKTKGFVYEWLNYCKDPRIISDAPNVSGKPNFESFIDHRHDQSILTNLCIKHNIQYTNLIRKFVGVSLDDINNYPDPINS
jgi:hypothetical protein